ncbi:MAG: protoporphyrinogen oxidase [Deltaproteobacteria bacterium CG23_combo_of_CG06-09_8_20_14_all_60_8]|nr:MAG: protoporphyrinogen oxidase [Deltaproteobacteria bacterium CG23_combo_of_CG06-09_8_20_14_all_60_8]
MNQHYDVIIVGSGLSGLSVAQFLHARQPELKVVLLEKGGRAGGAVQSFQQGEYRAEWGPHGFLDNCPEGQELIRAAGLEDRVQKAPLGQFARYLCQQGRLVELPQNPKKFLLSPILSPFAKLRLLGDLWIRPELTEQAIGPWASHRFGQAILPLVDAAITGSFAGDYQRLSMDAVMPGVRNLEKEHGSVLRGLLRQRKAAAGKAVGLPAMQNFPNGMEELTTSLARNKDIRFQCQVDAIARDEDGWAVQAGAQRLQGRRLVIALPVNAALALLTSLAQPPVPEIPVARIANVVMGFARADIPKAFGCLAPEQEKRFCLGAMFSSAMFPDRAPAPMVLLEALVGGRRHPERLKLADDELIRLAYKDLKTLLPLPEPPNFVQVLRPSNGIPQMEMGHVNLLAWRDGLQERHPDLYISGFGWDGIGMNEMIKHGSRVARAIADNLRDEPAPAAVRPVYF